MGVGVGGIVSIGGSPLSAADASGIIAINPGNQTGPVVTFEGVNGIQVISGGAGSHLVLIDGTAVSGVATEKFAASFSDITDNTFTHGLGSVDVIVQVYDSDRSAVQIFPDLIQIIDIDNVRVTFNTPQSGRVVIIG